jgi:hypothetical protein
MTNKRSYAYAAFAIAGLTACLTSSAQELVTNGSFEDTTAIQCMDLAFIMTW